MTSVFLNRSMLFLLLALPLLALLYVVAAVKRRRIISLLLDSKLSNRLIDPAASRKRRITEFCLLIAFIFIVLGAARPSWDIDLVLHPKTGRDLVFLLDISQSMLAEDQTPSRLGCAKNSILQCLDEFKSGRVGLVVFAGSTSIRCPLTRDIEFFKSTLYDLAPDSVPIGGTRIGDAIEKTVKKVFTDDDADYRDIILISDGENQDSITTNALANIADSGARLIIIGLGSDSVPAEIPIMNEATGLIAPLTYRDRVVRTKQNPKTFEEITGKAPDSIYLNVGTSPLDLADIYRTHIASSLRAASEQLTTERPREQYWRFLLAALIFISVSFLPWRKKSASPSSPHTKAPFILLLFILAAPSINAESRAGLFKDGVAAYHNEDYDSALDCFNTANNKKSAPVIDFNLGTTYYRLGDMVSALQCFAHTAATSVDDALSVKARYNIGNSMFSMAFSEETTDKETAMDLIRQAIAAYESALAIDPEYEDALYNLEIARNALELIKNADDKNNMPEDGSEKSDVSEEEDPTQQSQSTDSDSTDEQEQEMEEEQVPPNLTPEDILKEEEDNKLTRSRKKHADFAKTKMNW